MNNKKTAWEQLSASWKKIAAVIAAITTIVALICSILPWEVEKVAAVGLLAGSMILFVGWAIDKQQEYVDAIMSSHIRESDKKTDALREDILSLQKIAEATRLDTLRIQLFQYIQYQPDNVDTILKIAEAYFGRNGDWIAQTEFLKWSKAHNVEVPPSIMSANKGDDKNFTNS